MRDRLAVAAAALAAPIAGTSWWMLFDQISMDRAFRTPFPYLMLMASVLVATPVFSLTRSWIDGQLWRLLLLATLAAAPLAVLAIAYFLPPRSLFASFLILSTAWIASVAFWGALRLFSSNSVA
jgi:hypothetical protein